jgi:hypothetical protein
LIETVKAGQSWIKAVKIKPRLIKNGSGKEEDKREFKFKKVHIVFICVMKVGALVVSVLLRSSRIIKIKQHILTLYVLLVGSLGTYRPSLKHHCARYGPLVS